MDKLTPEQRRKNMQAVRSTGSKIETALAGALFAAGFRYRKNNKSVFGKPDLTFKKLKIAIFADSEFWHGKDWESRKREHKTKKKFWHAKIERNIARDKEVNAELKNRGWTVLRFWGKEIEKNLPACVEKIAALVKKKNEISPANLLLAASAPRSVRKTAINPGSGDPGDNLQIVDSGQ